MLQLVLDEDTISGRIRGSRRYNNNQKLYKVRRTGAYDLTTKEKGSMKRLVNVDRQ